MVVATRYAKSLLGLAVEQGQLETVYKDMMLVRSVCKSNRDFVNLLESPIVKTDKKEDIIKAVFEGKIHKLTMAFFMVLTQKRREGIIDDIAMAFEDQYKAHKNILTAVITSAIGLDTTVRNKVMELVKSQASGEVELIEKVDKNLIGGFVLTIGDKQVDASVSRRLNDLRKNFSENPFISEL